jgi:protein-tyrosine phosphatase
LFETAADSLREALDTDEKTLIHCHAGVSRSVSVAAAVLSAQHNQPVKESIEQIQTHRPEANPLGLLENYAKFYAYLHTDCQSLQGIPTNHRPAEFEGIHTMSEFGSNTE